MDGAKGFTRLVLTSKQLKKRMIEELKSKTQPVSKEQVWASWKRIKQGGKGAGVDNVTIDMIERNPRKYLYPLWNRLASGSYFPPPVKEVLIPKGKVKKEFLEYQRFSTGWHRM